MRVKKNLRGFTLIELLVVVAIIAILMALIMPSLARVRAQAKTVKCASNVRSIYMATSYYAGDNNNIIIRAAETTPDMGTVEWLRILNGRGYFTSDTGYKSKIYDKVRYCPAVPTETTTISSYILSYATSGTYRDATLGGGKPAYIRFNEFTAPASIFFFSDYIAPPADLYTHTVSFDTQYTRIGLRHGEQGKYFNMAWVDGHVSMEKHTLPMSAWAVWMWSSSYVNPF